MGKGQAAAVSSALWPCCKSNKSNLLLAAPQQQHICCLEAFPQSGWQRQQLAGLTSFLGHQVVGGVTWGVDALALGPLLQQPEVLLWVARVLLQPGYLQGQH